MSYTEDLETWIKLNENDGNIRNLEQKFIHQEFTIKEINDYPSVLERYYTKMYCLQIDGNPIDHHCVLFHSNKICLLTLAPTHPIIKENKTIQKVNYDLEGNVDRTKNKVTGKGKRGGQKLQPNTVLCTIQCSDGSLYNIYSCIKGKLIEMNENLYDNPNLLSTKPNTEGHLAVLLSNLSTVDMCKKQMINEDQYQKIIHNHTNC